MVDKPKIAIGVGGIFQSDRLAKALSSLGCEVDLFPTLPRSRFHYFDRARIHPILHPEVVLRASQKLHFENWGDLVKMRLFGRAFARKIEAMEITPDVVIGWSSFALEAFKDHPEALKILVRESSHILTQDSILRKEFARFDLPMADRRICIRRELQEYDLADRIFVLSQFALNSFVENGVPRSKLHILPMPTDTSLFYPDEKREPSSPLKVVYFGNLSIRKGVQHLLEATAKLPAERIQLKLVGKVLDDFTKVLARYPQFEVAPPLTQSELANFLRTQDVFVLPTMEDGFGAVVPQALASGLITVVTQSCGAADLIQEGKNGWVIEPGSPAAINKALLRLSNSATTVKKMRKFVIGSASDRALENYEERVAEIIGLSGENRSVSKTPAARKRRSGPGRPRLARKR